MKSLVGTLLNRAPVPYVGRGTGLAMPIVQRADAVKQMEAMGAVGTLFAIVHRLSNATSQVNWRLYRSAKSGLDEDRQEVTRHAALDLWNRPNDFMPRQEFVEVFQQHIDLTGEGWWIVARNPAAKLPLELWPARPDRMIPVPDRNDFIRGYIYTGPDGETIPLERDEVVFLRMPNPMDPYRGMGPVQSILADLGAASAAADWNRMFFENSAEPGGILEVERTLDDDEFNELSWRWNEQHRGVSKAHRVAILEGGLKWVDRTISQRDMQFTELRGVSRDTIREAFGMPKFAVGDVDDVNRATAEASAAWFAEFLMVPRLERIKAALNSELLPLYGASGSGLEFDYDDPVPESAESNNAAIAVKTTAYKTLMDAGADPQAISEYLELPDLAVPDTGDELAVGATPADLAEIVQKVYLGVPERAALTWQEARQLLTDAGLALDLNEPPPAIAGAPAAPGEAPSEEGPAALPAGPPAEEPAEPTVEPAAPGRRSAAGNQFAGIVHAAIARAVNATEETEAREDWEDRLDALVGRWTADVSPVQYDALQESIAAIVDRGTPADLADLAVPIEAAEALLAGAMLDQAEAAGLRVAEAAEAAGKDIPPVTPRPVTPAAVLLAKRKAPVYDQSLTADLRAAAGVQAKFLGQGLSAFAAQEALHQWKPTSTGKDVAAAVRSRLEELTDQSLRVSLGSQVWAAENEGRSATYEYAESIGVAPLAYEASERRDRNTCEACGDVDGKRWESLAEAQAAYPFGGYRNCAGRSKCRGTYEAIWK